MEKGFIITLSGISGVSKSHFIKSIIDRFDNFEKLKAVTTRQKRKDEVEGVDKFFLPLEEFKKKIVMVKCALLIMYLVIRMAIIRVTWTKQNREHVWLQNYITKK